MIHLPALLGYMVHTYQLFMTMTVHVALKVVEEWTCIQREWESHEKCTT